MKWWKKLLLAVLFLACVTGVATGIIFREDLQRAGMSKEIYESLLGPALEDEDVPSYEEATDENGTLSDKAFEKLLEKMGEQESAVILDCDEITVPESMPAYQKKTINSPAKAQILSLLEECAGDNPDSKKYRLSESPQVDYVPSLQDPIRIDLYEDGAFYYSREWYDLRAENPPKLEQKTAIMKAETFLEKLFSLLELHCDIMPSEQWEIEKTEVSSAEDPIDVYIYQNPGGRDEECYRMEMSCSLGGYPLFSGLNMKYQKNENSKPIWGNYFSLCYGASGWVEIDCEYHYDFQKTKKTYRELLSMKQAAKSLEKRLKLQDKKSGSTIFTATDARLGYFITDEKELRPAWCFSGPAHSVINEDAIYLIDAVTGRQLMKSQIGAR